MQRRKKPELLAPAGNMESFYTAIESGADAVYLGMEKFNARLRARNFTPGLVQSAVRWAHKKNRKVYITLNTLIKEQEIMDAVKILAACEALSPDALIVTDYGLIALARKHFPGLRLHASTQMGIHNTSGTAFARDLGIQRVILSRELTFKEISNIRQKTLGKKTGMELEVFVHGALCYSLSGYCLASSFLGGRSGNRGLCTQVCRRPFIKDKGKGVFFSPLDLEVIEYVPELAAIGIDSFKIEGRMKNPGYLSTVVSAYRTAIDQPERIPALLESLKEDFGRPKTRFFLSGLENRVLGGKRARTAGVYLGTVGKFAGSSLFMTLPSSRLLKKGDWIRILPKDGFEGQRIRITEIQKNEEMTKIVVGTEVHAAAGDEVYLADRDRKIMLPAEISSGSSFRQPRIPVRLERMISQPRNVKVPAHPGKQKLICACDSIEWFRILKTKKQDGIIITLGKQGLKKHLPEILPDTHAKHIYFALPYFIKESDIPFWKEVTKNLSAQNIAGFIVNNPGHPALLPANAKIIAGPFFYTLNSPARRYLQAWGVSDTIYSLEDDFLNIRNSRPDASCWMVLFGHVPLFLSRINPGFDDYSKLKDQNNNEFITVKHEDLHVLCGTAPFCLFSRRDKLTAIGITSFIVDFSYINPDEPYADFILKSYHEQIKIPGSSLFNFKAELR